MKLRVIERGDGKFLLQKKDTWWGGWLRLRPDSDDYPDVESLGSGSVFYRD